MTRHEGEGAFYALMPHEAMVLVFGVAFAAALAALAAGLARFWRATDAEKQRRTTPRALLRAIRDAARLRYLDGGASGGGDIGCMNEDAEKKDRRALFHHFTFYGFLLCFAATCVATLYHYALGREAPYPWDSAPVLLGTAGGIGLVVGPAGLLAAKLRRAPELREPETLGMDLAFLAMLLLAGGTGLALLLFRATPAMGPLLAIHLGLVLSLFVTMPYGKFVHGLYRFAALVRSAREAGKSEEAVPSA